MVCLNLLSDIRYKMENMYLAGIIPDSWERSIKFSKTACYPDGRVTRSAIALVVFSSHFYCSACDCYHQSTYGRVDFENWEPHDRDELRAHAEQWRDAATSVERERLFKAHGMCYSELWCLSYWDPSQQLVVDPMHCLLEGLVPHHTRNLLGLTSGSTTSTCIIVSDEEACFKKLENSLFHKNMGPLMFVCNTLGCMPQKAGRTFKIDYVKALLEWHCGKPLTAPKEEPQFGTAEVLGHIRDVSAGMLKADEWRSLIMVYLPIALVSLWGAGTSHSSYELLVHLRTVLDHTMELVCTVAKAYRSCISGYVGKLKEIHPTFSLRPNHHASFHLYDYLLLFGPAHSWWCFPFEHLIGILQHFPINHKFGELENTMLCSFIKVANCPPVIQECRILFDRVHAPKGATDPSQELAEDPMDDVVQFDGIIYSRASMHMGNSQILFYPSGDRSLTPVPTRIKYIYGTLTGEMLFAVQRHLPLDIHNHTINPFLMYPGFPAKLYSTNFQSHLEKVKMGWVVSHFAQWAVSDRHAVILSLSHD
ncbi:hypothetical protein BDR04DRAFT_1128869 [Suillus decipiens]|nr:hypothetical protein BDR04DRAFT_1128869 [Suillus decipiens]